LQASPALSGNQTNWGARFKRLGKPSANFLCIGLIDFINPQKQLLGQTLVQTFAVTGKETRAWYRFPHVFHGRPSCLDVIASVDGPTCVTKRSTSGAGFPANTMFCQYADGSQGDSPAMLPTRQYNRHSHQPRLLRRNIAGPQPHELD
jgi:hypothetical protein